MKNPEQADSIVWNQLIDAAAVSDFLNGGDRLDRIVEQFADVNQPNDDEPKPAER